MDFIRPWKRADKGMDTAYFIHANDVRLTSAGLLRHRRSKSRLLHLYGFKCARSAVEASICIAFEPIRLYRAEERASRTHVYGATEFVNACKGLLVAAVDYHASFA